MLGGLTCWYPPERAEPPAVGVDELDHSIASLRCRAVNFTTLPLAFGFFFMASSASSPTARDCPLRRRLPPRGPTLR